MYIPLSITSLWPGDFIISEAISENKSEGILFIPVISSKHKQQIWNNPWFTQIMTDLFPGVLGYIFKHSRTFFGPFNHQWFELVLKEHVSPVVFDEQKLRNINANQRNALNY